MHYPYLSKYRTNLLVIGTMVIYQTRSQSLSFKACDNDNWTCEVKRNITQLNYSCNQQAMYETLEVNLQALLASVKQANITAINSLTLSSCNNLTLNMHLDRKSLLKRIHIRRIGEFHLLGCIDLTAFRFHPPDIIIEDVSYMPRLSSGTITSPDAEDIIFRRVYIDLVETGAVTSLSGKMSLLIWDRLDIKSMAPESLISSLDSEGKFLLTETNIGNISQGAIQTQGGSTIIKNSKFDVIEKNGIKADVRKFSFTENIIRREMNRQDVTSPEIEFRNNIFEKCYGEIQLDWIKLTKRKSEEINKVHLVYMNNTICKDSAKETSCHLKEAKVESLNCSLYFQSENSNQCDLGDHYIFSSYCDEFCLSGICNGSKTTFPVVSLYLLEVILISIIV